MKEDVMDNVKFKGLMKKVWEGATDHEKGIVRKRLRRNSRYGGMEVADLLKTGGMNAHLLLARLCLDLGLRPAGKRYGLTFSWISTIENGRAKAPERYVEALGIDLRKVYDVE